MQPACRLSFHVKHFWNLFSDPETGSAHLTALQLPALHSPALLRAACPSGRQSCLLQLLCSRTKSMGRQVVGKGNQKELLLSIHVTMEYCSREGSCSHALLFSRLSVQPLTTTRSFWTSTTAGWPLMISVSSECPPELQTHPPAPSSQCNAHRHLRRVSLQHHVRTGWGDERRFALGHQTSLNYCSEVKHLATVSVG